MKSDNYLLDRIRIALENGDSNLLTEAEALSLAAAAIELATEATQVTSQAVLGQYGSKRVVGTDAVTPDSGYEFFAIQAEEDVVINTATGNMSSIDGAAITAEGTRYGVWSSITLTSGKAILYQRPEVV